MANYLYPDPASMDFFGEYMTPEIYPWLGQSTTSRVDRSAFSPLLFPQERPTTSPIIPAENLSRSIGEQTVIEPTDYRTEREKKLQEIENRIASSPISIQPYVSPKMADTQTNSNFMDNLGGLLFGGGGADGLEGYLSPQQQAAIQRQAMMQAAAALLKSSGTTTQPISLGQALGGAFEAGTAGYQGAQQNAIQQLLVKQKLDEMKRAQQSQQAYQNLLLGQPTAGEVITPDQAISAPGMAVGPTVERAAMIGQQAPSISPSGFSNLTREQRLMLSQLPAEKGIPEMLKLTQPSEKAKLLADLNLKPTLENLRLLEKPEAAPEKIRYLQALELPITLDNLHKLDKPEAMPNEIQILEAVKKPVTMENVMALRRSAASSTTNILNAEKVGTQLAYTQAVKNLGESQAVAQAANETIQNVQKILPALSTAITGPGADVRTTLLRVGKQLGIAGENADQLLANTATVVQGLAQQELTAASQMRGQGAITESERAILRRVAGGDQSLTANELKNALLAAERSAKARIASHADLLKKATNAIPEIGNIAPMYEVTPFGAPQQNPLQNAIQQELDKRKAAGGKR